MVARSLEVAPQRPEPVGDRPPASFAFRSRAELGVGFAVGIFSEADGADVRRDHPEVIREIPV